MEVLPADLISVSLESVVSGTSLRNLRRIAGFRQKDVSVALGLTGRGTYSDAERGRQGIPARWLPVLSALLGQPVSVITGSTTPDNICRGSKRNRFSHG
ncbi:helix-turn-helix domain-containing protein [Streptomyces sp. cmx-10-25]|uniref:helix-turn-helix domain-containing protein n=1 Tax=Streptomyces sp. cmx-10-25 TaxID=2790919 RepID=UPI003980DEBE